MTSPAAPATPSLALGTGAPPSITLPALDNSFGALLVGTFLGLMQYGWTAHQCYLYFRADNSDKQWLKLLVATVFFTETVHSVLCMHFCYFYLVSNFFNPVALTARVWSIDCFGLSAGVVILLSQLFFLFRVYMFGRRYWPIVVIAGLVLLAELGFSAVGTIAPLINPDLLQKNLVWINSAGVGSAALADTILTSTLVLSLHRSRTGIKQTDSLIDVLILYAVNTGLLTGVFNMASFVFAIVMSQNLIYVGIDIVAVRLYANTLMAVLNSRQALGKRARGQVIHASSMEVPIMQRRADPFTVRGVSWHQHPYGGDSPSGSTTDAHSSGCDDAWTAAATKAADSGVDSVRRAAAREHV